MATEAVLRFFQGRRFWVTACLVLIIPVLLCMVAGWVWYLDRHLSEMRQTELDLLWQEQTIRNSLESDQHMLSNWARDLGDAQPAALQDFMTRVEGFRKDNQAIVAVDVLDAAGRPLNVKPDDAVGSDAQLAADDPIIQSVAQSARNLEAPAYSRVTTGAAPKWALAVPIPSRSRGGGTVVAIYDLNRLLEQLVPWWFVQRYDVDLVDRGGARISLHDEAGVSEAADQQAFAFGPVGSGLTFKVVRHHRGEGLNLIFGLGVVVLLLGALVVWLLRVLRRWLSERLAAQRALSDELRFREAMENSTVTGLVALDLQGRIIYVNPAFCRLVGIAAEALVGLVAPFPFWPESDQAECLAGYEATLRGECPPEGRNLTYARSDGTLLSVNLYASLLVDGRRVARGWMMSIYDTTALHKEREALSASREQLYAVLAGLEAAVCVSALDDGRLLFRNRHHSDVFPLEAEGDCCLMPTPGVAPGISPCAADYDDPGKQRWYHLERRTIRWVDGTLVLLDIITDITAERLAANAARERDALLQQTARLASLAEFASGIAHELNQPLAAIANYSAVVESCLGQTSPPLDKVAEAALRIGDESRRAGQIIHSLRGAIQKRAAHSDVRDLRSLLVEPLALLEPIMQRKNIKVAIQGRRRPTLIKCDAVMIEQVLLNLIRNALEAVEYGERKLPRDAVAVRIDSGDDGVTVVVSDRGAGIQNPGALFQAFHTTKIDGMGLGLAICRTVIESHGGHLWAEPNPGGGARFAFRLPPSVVVQHEV